LASTAPVIGNAVGRARHSLLLSLDVEKFDLPREHGGHIGESEQMSVGAEGTRRLIDLIASCNVLPTLFCTAHFEREHPALIMRASEAGHEIASHGMFHSRFELAERFAAGIR